MNNNTKAAREARIQRMKDRGQYRFANMTKTEKEAYLVSNPAPKSPPTRQAPKGKGK